VPTAVVVGNGPRLFLVRLPRGEAAGFSWDPDVDRAASKRSEPRPEDVPAALVGAAGGLPSDTVVVATDASFSTKLAARLGRAVRVAALSDLRVARSALPRLDPDAERAFVRAVARRTLERALSSPEEVLVTLAREEERVERSLGREARAAEAFSQVPGSPLERHRATWDAARGALEEHHRRLLSALESDARALLPNLSAVVGPRVAARLLAAAGSLATLGRMSAPRLQLLGSRRRPSPDRGPRFGLIYRAERMGDLPLGRRGAFARSLAALACIAVRADASTRRDLSKTLVARRDRRVEDLRRRRR
jgi:snoRNA binding domain, fibrillarin